MTEEFTPRTKPVCQICGYDEDLYLGAHLEAAHGMSVDEYLDEHPNSPVIHPDVIAEAENERKKRQGPPPEEQLKVPFAGVKVPPHFRVAQDACLPFPPHYRLPSSGKAQNDVREAAIALFKQRSLYIWGLSGTGKDAFVHAYSAMTKTPAKIFQIQPGVDIEPWLFTRGFTADSTFYEEGELLRAARDGYTCEDGTVVPYILLITDFDRASRSQAEILRLITDSIEGRIPGPGGTVYPVLPGTTIVATANTAGGGDETGRYVSSNIIDSSLMGRFNRKIKFRSIEWSDEEPVIRAKFPLFARTAPEGVLAGIGQATRGLRGSIEEGKLYGEFSHRDLCTWIGHCEDILSICPKWTKTLVRRGAQMFLSGLPDEETRLAARRIIDPHIKHGSLDQGDTEGMRADAELGNDWDT